MTELQSEFIDKLVDKYTSHLIEVEKFDALIKVVNDSLNDHSALWITAITSLGAAIIGAYASYKFEVWKELRKERKSNYSYLHRALRSLQTELELLLSYKKQYSIPIENNLEEIITLITNEPNNNIYDPIIKGRIIQACNATYTPITFSEITNLDFIYEIKSAYSIIHAQYNFSIEQLNSFILQWNNFSITNHDDAYIFNGFNSLRKFTDDLKKQIDFALWFNRKFLRCLETYLKENLPKRKYTAAVLKEECKQYLPPNDLVKEYDNIT